MIKKDPPAAVVPAAPREPKAEASPVTAETSPVTAETSPVTVEPTTEPAAALPAKSEAQAKDDGGASFFAIQVGAFREEQRALKAVLQWRVREHQAFYIKPEADGNFYRVLVGQFDSLAEANGLATTLEASEQNKVFISLVSESQQRFP
jgi:cell division septation protein DedD